MTATRIPALGLLWLGLAAAYFAASASGEGVATLVVLGAMVGALMMLAGHRLVGGIAGIVLAALAWRFADGVAWLAFLPPLAAFAFMAYFFGRTLRAGAVPLIHRIAYKGDPDMSPEVVRYVRRLTALWTACFVALFLGSLALAFVLPLDQWARWVHGAGYLLPATFFLAEYVYRRHRFPLRHRDSLGGLLMHVLAVMREMAAEPERQGESR